MTTTNLSETNLRTMIELEMTGTHTTPIKKKTAIRMFVLIAVASFLWVVSPAPSASAQTQPPPQQSQDQGKQDPTAAQKSDADSTHPAAEAAPREHQPTSIGGELAKETRESEGEEEEHADLKHSTMVQKLAKVTGLSVHGAHLLALIVN